MKAIIMGRKRYQTAPATCDGPKPMVPFFGLPTMAYLISLIERTGIARWG
jgi:NDP-sugar pyrophosphorylase family protein